MMRWQTEIVHAGRALTTEIATIRDRPPGVIYPVMIWVVASSSVGGGGKHGSVRRPAWSRNVSVESAHRTLTGCHLLPWDS